MKKYKLIMILSFLFLLISITGCDKKGIMTLIENSQIEENSDVINTIIDKKEIKTKSKKKESSTVGNSTSIDTKIIEDEKDNATESIVYTGVTSVKLNPTKLTLEVGESATISRTVVPSSASDMKTVWMSSNENIASVSSNGVVSAKRVGTAKIIATVDGVPASMKITVISSTKNITPTPPVEETVIETEPEVEIENVQIINNPEETSKNLIETEVIESKLVVDDESHLITALESIEPKTITIGNTNLNYEYENCTIVNTENVISDNASLTEILDGIVTKLYRPTSDGLITSTYQVTCGEETTTKTVEHTILRSEYKYEVETLYDLDMDLVKIEGISDYILNDENYFDSEYNGVLFEEFEDDEIFNLVFLDDSNTIYAVMDINHIDLSDIFR